MCAPGLLCQRTADRIRKKFRRYVRSEQGRILCLMAKLCQQKHQYSVAQSKVFGLGFRLGAQDENYSVRMNPRAGMTWYYYYLYSLERACVIAGKRFFLGKNGRVRREVASR